MVPQKFRLPSSVVFSNAKFFREKEFHVKSQANNLSNNRYGFVVAKTIDKRATARNRIKRIFRSCIEEKWLKGNNGFDVLFIFKPAIKEANRIVLQQKIDAIMNQIVI